MLNHQDSVLAPYGLPPMANGWLLPQGKVQLLYSTAEVDGVEIKLRIMKTFVKAMDREDSGFAFLQKKVATGKHGTCIFDGLQIRELTKDTMFDEALSIAELSVWQSLKSVFTNFHRNHQSTKDKKEIEELLKSFHQLEALSVVTFGLFSKKLMGF